MMTMNIASADKWSTPFAADVAKQIASLYGIYCGPAAVVWIAAIWNEANQRPYEFLKRLKSKSLFSNGPRAFHNNIPGFETNLSDLLRRETNNELELESGLYFNTKSIYTQLEQKRMPFIIRIPTRSIKDGLHYVTLYQARLDASAGERFQFYWQDNGVYKSSEKIGPGLSRSNKPRSHDSFFPWGACQVKTA